MGQCLFKQLKASLLVDAYTRMSRPFRSLEEKKCTSEEMKRNELLLALLPGGDWQGIWENEAALTLGAFQSQPASQKCS